MAEKGREGERAKGREGETEGEREGERGAWWWWSRTPRLVSPAAANWSLHVVEAPSLGGFTQVAGRVAVAPQVHLISQLLVLADAAYSASLSVPEHVHTTTVE